MTITPEGAATDKHQRIVDSGAATDKHQRIVDSIVAELVERAQRTSPGEVEVKFLEVRHSARHGLTFLAVEVGTKGDEGTALSIFGRDYRNIHIGQRGGLTLMNAKRKSESAGRYNAIHALTR